jgi:hypothetical protein
LRFFFLVLSPLDLSTKDSSSARQRNHFAFRVPTLNSLQRGRFCLDCPEEAYNDWLHLSPRISGHENSSEQRTNYVTRKDFERMLRKKTCINDRITKINHQAEGK